MAKKRVVVRKKKIAKKKTAMASPASPRSPAYQDPSLPGEGFSFMSVIMLLITVALIVVVVIVFLPPPIQKVQGYPFVASKAPNPSRNLLREAEEVWIKGEGSVQFTEAEINTYLNQRLKVDQEGFFGSFTDVKGVYLDLEEDEATLYVVRKIFGLPLTVASTWEIFLSNEEYVRNCESSRIGRLSFSGKMFRPIMMPFERFAKEMSREKKLIFDEDVEWVKIKRDALMIQY